MKRFLAMMLSVFMIMNMTLSVAASGSDPVSESGVCQENLIWQLENGVLTISGTGYIYTTPNNQTEYPWYPYRSEIRELVIEEGVTSIGTPSDYLSGAFQGYTNLEKITLPGSLEVIGGSTFKGCTSLSEVHLNEGLTIIKNDVFNGCSALTNIRFPSTLTDIQGDAFAGAGLTEIVFTGNPVRGNQNAFYRVNATSVYYPQSNEAWTEAAKAQVADGATNFPWTPYQCLSEGVIYSEHDVVADAAVVATCTTVGLTAGSHCQRCGAVIVAQEEIAKLPHTTEIRGAVEPTTVATGYTGDTYCSVCNTLLSSGEVIPVISNNDLVWTDGMELEQQTIVGGPQDDPVVIRVTGEVKVKGTITFSTGYVEIVSATGGVLVWDGNTSWSNTPILQTSGGDAKLTLGENITLRGIGYESVGVELNSSTSRLTMAGATIEDCRSAGIRILAGKATMNSGIIRNGGDGVFVTSANSSNQFTMNGGTITGMTGRGVGANRPFTMTGGEITNCETGLTVSKGTSAFDCTLSGGRITENTKGVVLYKNDVYVSGGVYVYGNTEQQDFDLGADAKLILYGALTEDARINVRNAKKLNGAGVVAGSASSYQATQSDLDRISYTAGDAETSGNLTISGLRIDTSHNIVFDLIPDHVIWNDGDIVDAQTLVGGTQDPVLITVNGTVKVIGAVMLSSGKFLITSDSNGVIEWNNRTDSAPMFVLSSDANVTVDEKVTLRGSENCHYGRAFKLESGYPALEIAGATIDDFDIGVWLLAGSAELSSGTITNCSYGVFTGPSATEFVMSGGTIMNCRKGSGVGIHAQCGADITGGLISDCNVGFSIATKAICSLYGGEISGNKVGVSGTGESKVYAKGDIRICENLEKDFDLAAQWFTVTGELGESALIRTTNAKKQGTQGMIANSSARYTITAADLGHIEYVPLDEETTGNFRISALMLDAYGNVYYSVYASNLTWNDGDEVEAMTIAGGTREEPVLVTVNGTVSLKGRLTITGGYVNFRTDESGELQWAGGNDFMVYPRNDAHVDFGENLIINGMQIAKSGVRIEGTSKGSCVASLSGATIENCTQNIIWIYVGTFNMNSGLIQNAPVGIHVISGNSCDFSGGTVQKCSTVGVRVQSDFTMTGGLITECETGVTTSKQLNSETYVFGGGRITGNTTGIDTVNGSKVYVYGDIFVSDNKDADVVLNGNSLYVIDALTENAKLTVTGAKTQNCEEILAVGGTTNPISPWDVYRLQESDALPFTYVATALEVAGNGIYGEAYFNQTNNSVNAPISYKVYVPESAVSGTDGFILTPDASDEDIVRDVVDSGEGQNPGAEDMGSVYSRDVRGLYVEVKGNGNVLFRLDILTGYRITEDFKIKVGDVEVAIQQYPVVQALADDDDQIQASYAFALDVTNQTEIIVEGIEPIVDEAVAQVYGQNLTLAGEIGVNFNLLMPAAVVADEDAYVMLNDKKILVKDAKTGYADEEGYYFVHQFSYPVAVKETNTDITLRVYDGQDRPVTLYRANGGIVDNSYTYSAQRYLDAVRSLYAPGHVLRNLVEAMSDYGSCAQENFNYDTEHAKELLHEEDINAIVIADLAGFAPVKTGAVDGLSYYGSNLTLESETTVRHFFTLAAGHSISEYHFSVSAGEGAPVEATPVVKGSYYAVEIPNIAAKDLDTAYTLTVDDGNTQYRIQYSALSYAHQVLESETVTDALKKTIKAMYVYNRKANAYFEK